MLLSELLKTFANPKEKAHRLAKTTTGNYLCRLRRFHEMLGSEATVVDFTRPNILRYLERVEKISVGAVRMHKSAIHTYALWLKQEGWLRGSLPTENIVLPKAVRGRREPVPEEDINRLMEACDRLPRSEYRCALAKATFALLVYGGLRRSECLALHVSDVRTDTGQVVVRNGKGGKERVIYVCRECTDAVKEMLALRPDCSHDYLLAQNRRFPMMYHGLRNLFRDLHTVAGIKLHYTPHQLRHACASRLAANGAALSDIKEFLGHESLVTTSLYIHSTTERMQTIAHLTSLSHTKPATATQTKTVPPPAAKREEKRFKGGRLR